MSSALLTAHFSILIPLCSVKRRYRSRGTAHAFRASLLRGRIDSGLVKDSVDESSSDRFGLLYIQTEVRMRDKNSGVNDE